MALTPEQEILGVTPEVADLSRQKKIAELLMSQSLDQPQGQMISGQYVAPSWAQQLNPLFKAIVGTESAKSSDKKELELAQALRGQKGEALSKFQQLMSNPQTRGQAMQFAAGNQFLQPLVTDLMKPQKLGEGENLVMPSLGGGEPISLAGGGAKAAPDIKQAMQMLGINKPLDQLNPQELRAVNAQIAQLNASKRSNVTVNMPSAEERKAGFMANILDKNILQMQTALGVDPTAVKPNVPASIVEAVTGPNLLSRSITPAQRQIIEDSQLDVLDAALTLRTGAAYTKEQLSGMRNTYFPKLGDTPAAMNAKKQRLESLLSGAYIASGRATPQRVSEPYQATSAQPVQPSVNQQLNIPQAPKFLGFENANR
jgi:hypothetical protein